jgi:hypothetical protein
MPTSEVKIGGLYSHDASGVTMRLEAGSAPGWEDSTNSIHLVEPEKFGGRKGFYRSWRGTWDEFLKEWTEVKT